jgi:pyridoxal phosphate enzyme (YggS family)
MSESHPDTAAPHAALLPDRLREIRAAIAAEATLSGRAADAVILVAVSKTRPREDVVTALAAGQRVFGENRVQEAAAKFAGLHDAHPDIELHLIGPLQTNKVRDAVALFDVIETLDRPKLAESLAVALKAPGARTKQVLVEINTGEEPQKAGILPAEADAFIADCITRLGLPVVGVMGIPPVDDEPSLHFALLREIAKRHGLPWVSMGMSRDFPLAIQQGATHVRIGTALFGVRQ